MAKPNAKDAAVFESFLADFTKQFPERSTSEIKARLPALADRFHRLDKDKNGELDLSEFAEAEKHMPNAVLVNLVQGVDTDNNGCLSLREFINLALKRDGLIDEIIAENTPTAPTKDARGRLVAVKQTKRGQLELKIRIMPLPKGFFKLLVKIFRAADLQPMDYNGLADPFVQIVLSTPGYLDSKQQTSIIKKTLQPQWNEEFLWKIRPGTDFAKSMLVITVYDWDLLSSNDLMGRMAFRLSEIPHGGTRGWYMLLDKTSGKQYNLSSKVPPAHITEKHIKPSSISRTVSSIDRKLTPDDFHFLQVIGRGSFGKVLLAQHKHHAHRFYAIKVLAKTIAIKDRLVSDIRTERDILFLGEECPFLSLIHGTFQTPSHLFFVLEFYPGGDLMTRVKEARLPERTAAFYTIEIAIGLLFLRENGIIHRDLKLDNVLLDTRGHIHLSDFGLATNLHARGIERTDTQCGTATSMAPEVVKNRPYAHEADWWSVGVSVYEMATGNSLFFGDSDIAIYSQVLRKPIILAHLGLSAHLVSLLSRLLERDQSKRLGYGRPEDTAAAILADLFLTSHNPWENVRALTAPTPFVPGVSSPKDLSNFDAQFTEEKAQLSAVPGSAIAELQQELFLNFSFSTSEL